MFIYTEHGAVNLRHVVSIDGEAGRYLAELSNGRKVRVFAGNDDMERLCETIVPAAPGEVACVVAVSDLPTDGRDPEIWTDMVSVIAWGIPYGAIHAPRPILADPPVSNQHVLIKQLDGKWCLPGDQTFETLDDAKKEIASWRKSAS